MLAALWLSGVLALAQGLPSSTVDRPPVPSAGLATEDGPGALWVNPANMAFDPDARWGVFYRYDPDGTHPQGLAGTYGVGGLGAGLRWHRTALAESDFVFDLALGIKLPKRVAVGVALRWNILQERENFVAFDASAAWRPVPWFGLTALTRNIGNPGGTGIALPQAGVGLAFRPLGRLLVFGTDWLHTFDDFGDLGVTGPTATDVLAFTARVRPTSGLFLRAGLDTRLRFGAGIELYFGGAGFGVHAGSADAQGPPELVAWVGSDERDEHLAPPRRQVSALELERTPPSLPTRRLLTRDREATWLETLEHLRRVEDERGVRGMLLTVGDVDLSWARWRELRDGIRRVRLAGGVVVVHLVGSPGNGAVYAASAADRVLVHPASDLRLVGLSAETVYLKGLLDRVGVDVDVVRRSEFKAAAEPLALREPSAADRAQTEALLDTLHDELVTALAEGRARTRADVLGWIDSGPLTAEQAVTLGVADARAYPDQAGAHLEELVGGHIRLVDLGERRQPRSAWEEPAQIAIVYLDGTLTRGPSQEGGLLGGGSTGAETVVALLEDAARDVKIRAVVLRVDSPGGSAIASDEIWRAVERVQAAGKPVVASLGGVAASGGYYVACGTDAIWAEPTTITGSIGVVALKPNVAGLAERLGVTSTRITRGRAAAIDSPWRAWDPVERARVEALVDATYATFKDRVAEGRGLDPTAVEEAARGRVWSGRDAARLGLVDHLGGLEEALQDARRLAGLGPRRIVTYVGLRPRRPLLDLLANDVGLLATEARLARIDRAVVRWTQHGLAGPLGELVGLLALPVTEGEMLWLVDPWLLDVGPR